MSYFVFGVIKNYIKGSCGGGGGAVIVIPSV
jgi:hypothetical protein